MSKIKLKYAELHTALFLAGTNLGLKLDPRQRSGLEIEYDRTEKELWVHWNGGFALVPSTNVASMTLWPSDAELLTTDRVFIPLLAPDVTRLPPFDAGGEPDAADQNTQVAAAARQRQESLAVAQKPKAKATAQVSTPTSHVFEGPGSGRS